MALAQMISKLKLELKSSGKQKVICVPLAPFDTQSVKRADDSPNQSQLER